MKYIDRMGNVTVEENGQDKLLRHLYNDRGGRLCLRVLVSPWISKMAGRLLNTGFSARFVGDFVEKNRIDLSICEKQKFSSWNDFFTRRLRQENVLLMKGERCWSVPAMVSFLFTGLIKIPVFGLKIQNIQWSSCFVIKVWQKDIWVDMPWYSD